jgi:predicted HicB family RNase H-like nuclease
MGRHMTWYKFALRIPENLAEALTRTAKERKDSINNLIVLAIGRWLESENVIIKEDKTND